MSREEKIMDNLFEQARNKKVETPVNEIQRWIGLITIGMLLTGLLTKMKLVFTKSVVVMYSTAILTVGIGLGTYFLYGTEKQPEQRKRPMDIGVSKMEDTNEIKLENELPPPAPLLIRSMPPVAPKAPEAPETPVSAMDFQEQTLPPFQLPVQFPFQYETKRNRTIVPVFDSEKDYGTFHSLKLSGAVDHIYISQGTKESVKVEADENGREALEISNTNKTLEITTANKKKGNDFVITIYLTVVDLKSIECFGAVNLSSKTNLKFDNLKLTVMGATDVELDLTVPDIDLDLSGASDVKLNLSSNKVKGLITGASDVKLSGSAAMMDMMSTGACELKAELFKVKTAKMQCSGASSSKIHVTDTLEIDASGASDLKYRGTPKISSKLVTGASQVRQF
ncbi:DUF2807 domain-containing protein [Crocinitomicaceae bacterium CZZ-1]|uniref:DUF2807 domain-containing protein n=1 Tax=Taishania pollutisoli TaxID=2766479 RepID=A0A8J6PN28_9FLAO|nr:head GIN domain-containing protein [Taishania pollutisoli]MBC9811238.1 DUF2807 domain-containing protein [Taishania pollutisoli]MBX2947847.1 DUF2807 domain-containing protein [Crocinitomicaceae bacterium]NGF75021.1 DUF2807 domain-containing protein [Fluviicola sp. SGL-29]